MNKRAVILTIAALVLGTVYVLFFTDWLRHEDIQILMRSSRPRFGEQAMPVFLLEEKVPVDSIKVFRDAELQTNKYPHALWHLVPKSNAPAVTEFSYGHKIKGFEPYIPGSTPDPLEPGVQYKLVIQSGSRKAEKSFSIQGSPGQPANSRPR